MSTDMSVTSIGGQCDTHVGWQTPSFLVLLQVPPPLISDSFHRLFFCFASSTGLRYCGLYIRMKRMVTGSFNEPHLRPTLTNQAELLWFEGPPPTKLFV